MKHFRLIAILFATTLGVTAQAQPAFYTIEPTHTFVYWQARHFGVSTSRGRFDKTSGQITYDVKAKKGTVEVLRHSTHTCGRMTILMLSAIQ
jgi:polyisoprenoid-binding protein YceI